MRESLMTDALTGKLRGFVQEKNIKPDPAFALHPSGVHSVVNCVFSAQVRFGSVVEPLLKRLGERLPDTPDLTFDAFITDVDKLGFQRYAEEVLTRHRLARKLKVEVAYCTAKFFVRREYQIQAQFQLPSDLESQQGKAKVAELEKLILEDLVTEVHGIGPVLARYLMWLLGDERHVKPDTLLTRLLSRVSGQELRYGHSEDMEAIRQTITTVAAERGTTPARLDNALWRYESTRKAQRQGGSTSPHRSPTMTADELLAGIPEGTLRYTDIPEWTPVGREWGGEEWDRKEQGAENEN